MKRSLPPNTTLTQLDTVADEDLVRQYANGCDEAFDKLLMRYKERTFGYIYGQVRDEDRANDIFQETFVKVITSIRNGKYTENGKFGAWLSRVAHNLVMDYFRGRKGERLVWDDEYEGGLINRITLVATDPEESITNQHTLTSIVDLLDLLPQEQRKLVQQRIFEGLSFKTIAKLEGISINTALGRMRYALINLRKHAKASGRNFYYY